MDIVLPRPQMEEFEPMIVDWNRAFSLEKWTLISSHLYKTINLLHEGIIPTESTHTKSCVSDMNEKESITILRKSFCHSARFERIVMML